LAVGRAVDSHAERAARRARTDRPEHDPGLLPTGSDMVAGSSPAGRRSDEVRPVPQAHRYDEDR